MGLPRCSRLECWCSAATLPLPHNCGKIHLRGTNLRHSGVQASSPHPAHRHTQGPHCPRREQTYMRLTRCSSHRMRQSTFCDRGAPPGHPTMDKNHNNCTDEAALYHASTHAHTAAFYTAHYEMYPQRPSPKRTSKGGHSKASRLPNTNTATIHCKSR